MLQWFTQERRYTLQAERALNACVTISRALMGIYFGDW